MDNKTGIGKLAAALNAAQGVYCFAQLTATFTEADGTVTIFAAIDHCTAECTGIHAVKRAVRLEALEPIRQGVQELLRRLRGWRRNGPACVTTTAAFT